MKEETKAPEAPVEKADEKTGDGDLAKFTSALEKLSADIGEIRKGLGKVDEIEKAVAVLKESVETLTEFVGKLPAAAKGQLRPVKKEEDNADTADALKKSGAPEGDPFITGAQRIA